MEAEKSEKLTEKWFEKKFYTSNEAKVEFSLSTAFF